MIKSMDENQFLYDLLRNTSVVRAGDIGLLRRADNKFYWIDNRTGEVSYKSGTVANQITLEACRIAVIFQEATMVEHRMTTIAYLPVVLLSANGQFRRGKVAHAYTQSLF